MNRREFITLLGGRRRRGRSRQGRSSPSGCDASAYSRRLQRTGPEGSGRLTAFLQGLQELGWTDGRNVRIVYGLAEGDAERVRRHAADVIALVPDVVLANGTTALGPLLEVTRTVPIVFVQITDPVSTGYVESLARPGGNVTGFSLFEYGMSGKWLELLRQIAPRVTRAAASLATQGRRRNTHSWRRCTPWPRL